VAASKRPSPGRKSDKEWRDAIRIAVNERDEGTKTKKLRLLADKLVAAGLEGDMQAIKEIGDRLDGRPAQAVQHQGNEGGPVELIFRGVSE